MARHHPVRRYNYDTSSSESFDLTDETDSKGHHQSPNQSLDRQQQQQQHPHQQRAYYGSSAPPLVGQIISPDGGRVMMMDVEQIEVVQIRGAGSIADTASFMTEESSTSADGDLEMFDLRFTTRTRRISDGSSSAPPPPSLHRERTAPTSNLAASPTKRDRPRRADTRTASITTTLPQKETKSPIRSTVDKNNNKTTKSTERLMPPTRKSTPQKPASSELRKPSPCPVDDQPSRPVRKASPGYHISCQALTPGTAGGGGGGAIPPARVPSDATNPHGPLIRNTTTKTKTTKENRPRQWKSINFKNSGHTKAAKPPKKPPLAPKDIGQRRWREGPVSESSVDMTVDHGMESQDSRGTCTTPSLESICTSSGGFESEGRRLSSLTFLTHQAPVAPGEAITEEADHDETKGTTRDIILDGYHVIREEEAPLNDSSKTEMVMSTCGQTIPPLVYDDIIIREEAVVQLSSRMPSSSTDESNNRSEESHVHTSPSMITIPEVEFGTADQSPDLQTTAENTTSTTPQSRRSRWQGLSRSLRSLLPSLSSSARQHANGDEHLHSSNGRILTSDQGSSRRTMRSLITASWSLVLPTRRLESSIQPVKVKVEREKKVWTSTVGTRIIYGLIVACVFLTAIIICFAILLAGRNSEANEPNSFPTSAPTVYVSTITPTAVLPSKPGDAISGPRMVDITERDNGSRQLS